LFTTSKQPEGRFILFDIMYLFSFCRVTSKHAIIFADTTPQLRFAYLPQDLEEVK
jgi:hypothetical protein